jgi:leucyl aminopeptidase (aminopeptidase T)
MPIPPSPEAISGVETLLDSYVGFSEGDGVALFHSRESLDCAAWISAAVAIRGLPCVSHRFDHRDDHLFAEALAKLSARLNGERAVRRLVVIVCEVATVSFTRALKTLVARLGSAVKVVRITNCVPDLFELALRLPSEEQKAINAGVLGRIMGAPRVSVSAPGGTHLEVSLDTERRWVSNFGMGARDELIVMPPGEVNTVPALVSGTMVVDGAINLNLVLDPGFDVRLHDRPIRLDIRDSVIEGYHCDDPALVDLLDALFADRCNRVASEFGIGTNTSISRFIPLNSHINERHPGVHVGFGEQVPPEEFGRRLEVHLDAIVPGALIHVPGAGTLDTSRLEASRLPHPEGTLSEDTEHWEYLPEESA